MLDVPNRRVRLHALGAVTAMVLSSFIGSASAAERINLGGLKTGQAFEEFIVKYRGGSHPRTDAAALKSTLNKAVQAVPALSAGSKGALNVTPQRRLAVGADVIRAGRKLDRVEAEILMRQIAADPDVEYIEVNKINRAFLTPNDALYPKQWGYQDPVGGIGTELAWDMADGTGVVVAVLDTGITNHVDLGSNILPGYDFISAFQLPGGTTRENDGDGRDADPTDAGDWLKVGECGTDLQGNPVPDKDQLSSWHGTHVTGTVAARTLNLNGGAGTAFKAKVVPVRVLGKCGGTDADIADAVIWASGGSVNGIPVNANPAEVINLSLGSRGACGRTFQDAINSAVSRGTTVVVAAGNSGEDASEYSPASCDNVITVAANNQAGGRPVESNHGVRVDIAAPGVGIMSTVSEGAMKPYQGSSLAYTSYSGTSMSAAFVSGVVALMQSRPGTTPKTPAEIEKLIKSTARAFPASPDKPIGAGIINAKVAVESAGGGPGINQPPISVFGYKADGLTVNFTDASRDIDGTIVSRLWTFGDGSTSTAVNPSKTYAAPGSYVVTLRVVDDKGAACTKSVTITVSAVGVNKPPVSNFTYKVTGLTVRFTDVSSDIDGTIVSRNWSFGDGAASTAASPSKTYAAPGTYAVKLTVKDDKGASCTKTSTIIVSAQR